MSEFYTDWEDPKGLAAWKKARELFFRYYADFFSGERPLVELVNVPYEDYSMPVLKFNAEKPKGTLITGLLNIVLYGFGWQTSACPAECVVSFLPRDNNVC